MRISDWSSDVCSSDLPTQAEGLYGFSCGKAPPKEGLVDSGWFLQLLVKGRGGRYHRAGGALATTVYFEPPVLLDHGGSVSAADKHSESSVSKAAAKRTC